MGMNFHKLWEIVENRGAWCAAVHGVTKSWTRLNNNTCFTGVSHFRKCLILIEVCACMLSCFSRVQCFAILWTVAARLLCPWSSPGKNTRAVCHALLQGLFATQESNACLLQCWQILYYWATREAPTEVQLSYNIVLVLGVQHSYWVTHTHTHISFSDSFPI